LLLAVMVDELRRGNWLYVAAHAKRPGPAPEPLLRPGSRPKADSKPRYTLEQASMLDPRLRAQHEAQMRAKEGG
jgi:hypothetical protein